MRRSNSNITKSNFIILSCFGFLFVVLQFLFLGLAEAQTYNKIEFVYNIEQMKGHLEQAVVNKENGNNTLTQAHIQHPIVEIYDVIQVQLASVDSNHNTLLFNSLSQLSKNADNLNLAQFEEETTGVNQILDKASDLVVPEDNSTLTLIVASWLLDAANAEYESGIRSGKIIQIVEYQDAIGFISRSESLLSDTLPTLNQSMTVTGDEAFKLYLQLNSKVQTMADINDIYTITSEIKQKIANITGF
ncbi:MAG TPA: hypothetical protein VE548_12470 [Nitrososphaeraceae archaeon]|nr:hypothetical protein [Nitrososphaeraceae archaeon]